MDFAKFWEENTICRSRPFSTDKPRAALSISIDDHWLFGDLGDVSTLRYYAEPGYRIETHKRANDRLEAGIGIRVFSERAYATPRRIEFLFGSRMEYIEGGTPWLVPGASTPIELAAILDTVEETDPEPYFLHDSFRLEWQSVGGGRQGGGSRGPATIGTCVCGVENYLTWMIDEPDLMDRFHRLMAQRMVARDRLLRRFTGNESHGFGFLDDNCCLVSPGLYERFCLPVLRAAYEAFSPDPGDSRYQHSDSAMRHLMPLFRSVGMNGVNFGPEVAIEDIRRELPDAMIHGHIPPFLLMRGARDEIAECVAHSFSVAGPTGQLLVTTAGSVSCGTTIERLRWLMEIVEKNTRY